MQCLSEFCVFGCSLPQCLTEPPGKLSTRSRWNSYWSNVAPLVPQLLFFFFSFLLSSFLLLIPSSPIQLTSASSFACFTLVKCMWTSRKIFKKKYYKCKNILVKTHINKIYPLRLNICGRWASYHLW